MNSFEKFGTITFDRDYMHNFIKKDDARLGSIAGQLWWRLVPEVYREVVLPLVQEVFEDFYGQELTSESLAAFIDQLCDAIWDRVEPVR